MTETREPPRTRLEERTPNTAECPDTEHHHWWRKRRPELTLGQDRFLSYVATADGTVVLSEEALAQLLRLGGFEPATAEDLEPPRALCEPLPADAEPPTIRTLADPEIA